ncbi:UDP-glucose 4-epimerase GalE [Sphingomonas immobilis]|uniref:UDP-glucose 4-epimerase n=1 Tax=Sphingomonas immobilis TaxID=3063997 RepID=A0ABT8ZTP1_9SPHN|nr:UDP-glucose 4-epimerase GalE [Sphingomonas sp. CA1-15]MDO7840929.1 UDP-glucose 4-epimerase GalE [Sphingomonas sp. CA1-15]
MTDPTSSPGRGTVLVTGGAGYIGSHTCKALRAAGYDPVVFDNLVYGHAEAVRWGVLERGDIGDRARLDAVIAHYAPTAIVHFAAYAYVGESVTDPGKYYRNNFAGTLTLLEAARDHGIGRFIFSSTCATYGVPSEIPILETTPQSPINPYGASKLMIERVLADFGVAHDLRWIALRYFNAAGADPENETGELHDPETHLIPLALDAASGRRAALTIFGQDYDTADGTCVRDYIHVSDLADAHVLALAALERGVESQPLNLGNGNGFSVRDVVRTVEAITGLPVPHDFGPRRPGDPPALISDARRARELLGWQPRYADLDAIVRTAWAWHQRNAGTPAI